MHQTSYDEMARMLNKHLGDRFNEPLEVLDVGSRQVEDGFGKTYRDLMPTAWRYTGCDGLPGPNVDLVCLEAYRIQESGECYDLVISGQCLEHVELPHLLVCEMARMCRPGGWLIVTAPWQWHYHPHPIDCWRILPHGMEALFRLAGLETVEAYREARDCWGVARKPWQARRTEGEGWEQGRQHVEPHAGCDGRDVTNLPLPREPGPNARVSPRHEVAPGISSDASDFHRVSNQRSRSHEGVGSEIELARQPASRQAKVVVGVPRQECAHAPDPCRHCPNRTRT